MSAFRKAAIYTSVAVTVAAVIAFPRLLHARPMHDQIVQLLFSEIPLSSQQKLRELEDKINAIAEGRIKLKLKDGVQLPDIPTLRGIVEKSIPAGTLRTNMLILLNDANPVGIPLVSAYLFYANNLNQFLAAYWSDPKNFDDTTPKSQPPVAPQPVAQQQVTPQPKSQRLVDIKIIPGVNDEKWEVDFLGQKIQVNLVSIPSDPKVLERVEQSILTMFVDDPRDLRGYLSSLSNSELGVLNSVIIRMQDKKEYAYLLENDDFKRVAQLITEIFTEGAAVNSNGLPAKR